MSALPPRVVRFRRILTAVTALAHGPFAASVLYSARNCAFTAPYSIPLAALAVAGSLVLFARRADEILDDRPITRAHRAILSLPYFVHWTACFAGSAIALVATLCTLIAALFRHTAPLPTVEFLAKIHLFALLIGFWGVYPGRTRFAVREREVRLRGLPPAFDGYRIAQLSDLHIGGLTPKEAGARWTAAANEAAADLIVVTGDSVTNGIRFHEDIAEVLAPLRAPDGVFYAMGNHDYFNDGQPLRDLLAAANITVLRNSGCAISRGSDAIYLNGVDDVYTRKADLDATFAGRPEGMFIVLLAHDPKLWDGGRARGAGLTLSGHTHGGQIAVPFFARALSLSSIAHRHHLGFYEEDGAVLYVHPGLGTTGPPVRIGVGAEVTILILRSA